MQANHEFTSFQEDYQIVATLFNLGSDCLIVISGGDHPHIGTVTTKTLNQDFKTERFPSHDGRLHQDHLLAEPLVQELAPLIKGNLVVLSGVHVDGITQKQIAASQMMIKDLIKQIKKWLNSHPRQFTPPKYYGANDQPD